MSYILELAQGVDIGRTKENNEDCVGVDTDKGIFILADGIGGHNAGEIASAMAVDFLLNSMADIQSSADTSIDIWKQCLMDQLVSAVVKCNSLIYSAGQREIHMKGMGTTVVAGFVVEDQLIYVHVGDSRLYRLRKGRLDQLTEDHTLFQEVKKMSMDGEIDYEATIPRNIVTRALGADPEVKPDTASTHIQAEDVYLICSDGLSDKLPDDTIHKTIGESGKLASMVDYLIMQANEAGGEDNISVILMGVKQYSLLQGFKRLIT
ncbi:MAG: serine/threonine-protein phosphatase [Gammaproteobacteria bacterium]|nr:serine/threonine-protein phosphatase [Gammaproteobacteria bacterium]